MIFDISFMLGIPANEPQVARGSGGTRDDGFVHQEFEDKRRGSSD